MFGMLPAIASRAAFALNQSSGRRMGGPVVCLLACRRGGRHRPFVQNLESVL